MSLSLSCPLSIVICFNFPASKYFFFLYLNVEIPASLSMQISACMVVTSDWLDVGKLLSSTILTDKITSKISVCHELSDEHEQDLTCMLATKWHRWTGSAPSFGGGFGG